MISFILWYLALIVIGWLAVPLAYRLLRFLPDRGLLLSKPLGLLVYGFLFWLLASLHAIQNDSGGVIIGLGLLAGLGWWAGKGQWAEIRQFLGERKRALIISETLFFLAFAFWALVRAANPEAAGTEKPMELAFINAILNSPSFPPHDPWLSGYSISYYYFGYVLVAMLARLTGIAGSIAFNLGLASWFGLVAVSSHGVLFNLLELRKPEQKNRWPVNAFSALLAPLFILLVSNLVGPLEVMHASGTLWSVDPSKVISLSNVATFPPVPNCTRGDTRLNSSFWSWIDLQELNCPPTEPLDGTPKRVGGIWWWRSSRVLTDYDLNNAPREVIDEFPSFSYLLGDLHPHVLSMPFVLLAVALALDLYLGVLAGAVRKLDRRAWLRRAEFWLTAVVMGGLAFLNTWDFPIYLGLYCCAYGLAMVQVEGWAWRRLVEMLVIGGELGLAGIVLYLPFYLGFASQAGGVLPSLSFFSRGVHFWIMFATLLIPILGWLVASALRKRSLGRFGLALGLSAGVVFGLWVLSYLFGWLMLAIPDKSTLLVGIQGGVQGADLLLKSLVRRLNYPGMWLSMLGLLALVFMQLIHVRNQGDSQASIARKVDGESGLETRYAPGFIILLVLVGSGLVLLPEFFYLRDQFGWRMNTIFKFYFQAWILWAVAAAYAVATLSSWLEGFVGWTVRVGMVLVIACGLVYPAFLIPDRTQGLKPQDWSLDGADYIRRYQPDDYNAIQFLKNAQPGVVAEAVGGSYDASFARVATQSGHPTVLGWPGHESQWRGGGKEIGSREADIEALYNSLDWDQAYAILQRYTIRYIFVGTAEMSKYRVSSAKFDSHLKLAYSSGSVKVYELPAELR